MVSVPIVTCRSCIASSSALCALAGPVDFVGQHDVREDRALLYHECSSGR